MKFLAVFIFFFLIFSSCDVDHKKIVYVHPDGYFREEYYINKDDSLKDGLYIKYFPNGKMWDSCTYTQGVLHGIRKVYGDMGNLEVMENYKNGVFEGDYKVFYPDGRLKLIQQFINGKIQGLIKEKVTMKDNEENGHFEEYYENGTLHWKGSYLNGDNEQDTLYEFGTTGELIKKMYCQSGVCETIWRSVDYPVN